MNFALHTQQTAPEGSRETLGKIVASYGFLPNLAGAIAESPATLNGLVALMGAFEAPAMTLSPVERQVVLLAVSVRNECEYCTAAHGMLAHMNGLDRAEIDRLQRGEPLADARLQALRGFVDAVVERRGRPGDGALEAFLAAGYTKAQLLEVVMGVALKTLTNYVNHIAQPPVNEQFAAFLPPWSAAA